MKVTEVTMGREFSLCAPPRCHCPKLIMDDGKAEITITDDYSGVVSMSYADFTVLARRFLEHV